MYKSGEFVAENIEPQEDGKTELRDKQVQPNGVDLTIGKIYELSGPALLEDEEYTKNDREELDTLPEGTKLPYGGENVPYGGENGNVFDLDTEAYVLTPGKYVVVYGEIIEIPDSHIGFVYPRSRLLRVGGDITSAVWDAGYRGIGEGTLTVETPTLLEPGMRIAQMVMCRASTHQTYDGHAQNEKID